LLDDPRDAVENVTAIDAANALVDVVAEETHGIIC
jgi:hypothetical protein